MRRRSYSNPASPPHGFALMMAVLVKLLILVPGTDISLVLPAEYVILLAWFALGALIYAIAPKSVTSKPSGRC